MVLILKSKLSVRLSLYLTVPSGAVLVAGLARRLEVPYPALLALAGAGLAFLPFAPAIEIEPDLALALFVAPVLLDAAFDTSPRDLKRYAVSVASLAVVAVNFAVAGFPFPEPLPSTE